MAKPRTLYVSRPLLNGEALRAWARSVGFVSTLPASDMHVTIAFSKRALDWSTVPPKHGGLAVEVGQTGHVKRLGKAIVLRFDSTVLRARWQQFRDAGAAWDHPEYQPHVTISYTDRDDWPTPPERMQPYDSVLRFGAEKYAEIREDWAKRIEEEPLRKSLVLLKARIRGGALADLFAAPVEVHGHMREGRFVAPHQATRLKRAQDAEAPAPASAEQQPAPDPPAEKPLMYIHGKGGVGGFRGRIVWKGRTHWVLKHGQWAFDTRREAETATKRLARILSGVPPPS